MLWIRKDIEVEQVPVQSSDLTAAVLRIPERSILVVYVYVEVQDKEALLNTTSKLQQIIQETRDRIGTRDEVSQERQGEADPIIDLMSDHALSILLPRGTKTWQIGNRQTTIDLVLASEELASTVIKCAIHGKDLSTGVEQEDPTMAPIFESELEPEALIDPRLRRAPESQLSSKLRAPTLSKSF
jgi:hypothetical protein